MEITLLGPLNAQASGSTVVPSATKTRQILALLALNANHVVPVPSILEELWGSNPPRSAMTTLQTYILRLRRIIGLSLRGRSCSARDVLVYRHDGYCLDMGDCRVDALEFDRLATEGHRFFLAGDDMMAAETFRLALGLWRGAALEDIRSGPLLEIERVRLEESRLTVLERRIDSELCLGRHGDLLPELSVLTARHNLHEGLYAQRIIALYRAGRPAEALSTFNQLRHRLVDELGLDPSPKLQRLQQALLSGDTILESRRRHPGSRLLDMFAA